MIEGVAEVIEGVAERDRDGQVNNILVPEGPPSEGLTIGSTAGTSMLEQTTVITRSDCIEDYVVPNGNSNSPSESTEEAKEPPAKTQRTE